MSARYHTSVGTEIALREEAARLDAVTTCIDWLAANGHADAAKALDAEMLEHTTTESEMADA